MRQAPERIWLVEQGKNVSPLVSTRGEIWSGDKSCIGEYHLAREGQPCSDREFIERVTTKFEECDMAGSPTAYYDLYAAITDWLAGDFKAAMEGLGND